MHRAFAGARRSVCRGARDRRARIGALRADAAGRRGAHVCSATEASSSPSEEQPRGDALYFVSGAQDSYLVVVKSTLYSLSE